MDTKTIAVIVVFGALTVALCLSPAKIPAPYAPFLKYQIWEIPIVAAFLLFGLKVGLAISIINTAVLLAVYPGELPAGPFYNFAAILGMLLGLYIVERFSKSINIEKRDIILPTILTTVGIVFRVVIMSIVNFAFLPFPFPIGYSLPIDAVLASLPVIGFFNATLALYTIPIGYLIARIVSMRLRITTG